MANKVEVTCNGRCVEVARSAFDKASYTARPESREMDNLSKRFRLLRDIDATDKHTEAEINLEHALALYEAAFGQEHPAVAHIMLALADVYRSHGNEESAKYMTIWADEILQRPKEEPTHEFFHLFGMNRPEDAPDARGDA